MANSFLDSEENKLEVLRLKNDNLSYRKIGEIVGCDPRTISKFLKRESYRSWWEVNGKPIASGTYHDHHHKIKKMTDKVYVLTSAQNNTYVNDLCFKSLMKCVEHRNAKLIVGTFSYNKNGFQNLEKGQGEWFDPKIKEYILDEPVELAEGLLWLGELNILPTVDSPTSGYHSYTGASSGIIPHPKVQLESLPRHKASEPRFLYTTGCITKRNYIQKNAGQKASFHHIYGALIVEVDKDGDWFVRQLSADNEGNIYDLDTIYTPEDYTEKSLTVEAINWGDLHSEKKDEVVYDACFRKKGNMLDTLVPEYQFAHDILDFEAQNHHNIGDPYIKFSLYKKKKENVENNIRDVVETLTNMHREFCQTVVVESNHDLALKRWLKTSDYRQDPENALFYLRCQLKIYEAMDRGDYDYHLLEDVVKEMAPFLEEVMFLKTDQSFRICDSDGKGIECGMHGDLGVSGSRGSINQFKRTGSRINIGHSHSAGIKDGVYQAGALAKSDMGYNRGMTNWSHSNIITYLNGKRAIITIKNGKWCA